MLSGCSSLTTKEVNKTPIQENLLVKCEEQLDAVTGTTGKDAFLALKNDAVQYNECAARHNALVDIIKDGK